MSTPTVEQLDFINEVSNNTGSIVLEAVAGSGKTTTAVKALTDLDEQAPFISKLCVAFNKRIADELRERMPVTIECRTMNALGHRAWMRHIDKPMTLDSKKVYKNLREVLDGDPIPDTMEDLPKLVNLAKQVGLIPETDSWSQNKNPHPLIGDDKEVWEELIDHFELDFLDSQVKSVINLARGALTISINDAFEGLIDFNDQLYMPVCFNAKFPRFDIVLIDEAQDISGINRVILQRCLTVGGGRLLAIGDPYQAIYGFRGASSDSMEIIKQEFHASTMSLTCSFRCASLIIKEAAHYVPHITSAPDAIPGTVTSPRRWNAEVFREVDAVLCRNTAPLVDACFKAIKNQIPAYVLGRDIGAGVLKLIRRLHRHGGTMKMLVEELNKWQRSEMRKFLDLGREMRAEGVKDRADTIRAIITSLEGDATVDKLKDTVKEVFSVMRNGVCFSTIHKAKGLEWDRVVFLSPSLIPSFYAKQEWQLQQEMNLKYVAITRARRALYYVEADEYEDPELDG